LARGKGAVVIAELRKVPADRGEGFGQPVPLAGGPEQFKGLTGVVEGLGMAGPTGPHDGEAVVGCRPARVAGLAVQVERVPQLVVGVVEVAQPTVGKGEYAVGEGLRGRVREAAGGGHGAAPGGGPVLPLPAPDLRELR
jgi:hypothetical protein